MMSRFGITIAVCIIAVILAIVMGNGAVYFFNKIPGKWLCDYDEEPDEELLNPTRQRIKSVPWKYLFSGLFVVIALRVLLWDFVYGIVILITCWLLLLLTIADIKYKIVPDQLVMLLALTAIAHLSYNEKGVIDGVWGALTGFGIMLIIGILGRIFYKKETLGGGDIKLFGAIGLCLGMEGVLFTFVVTTLLSAGHFSYLLLRRRAKKGDALPMVPYIAVSVAIYLVILKEMSYNIMVHL